MAEANLTAERLRELLHYDPVTGFFFRRFRTNNMHKAGDRADRLVTSGKSRGYYRVSVAKGRYQAHRLAWLYVHGKWPDHTIDHINGDKGDNRVANLRDIPGQANSQNMRKAFRSSKTGLLGAYKSKLGRSYYASIGANGVYLYLGKFPTAEEAHAAYIAKKRELHPGCTL